VIHLFLFDVDGVLVEAHGYLKALQDTVAHFSRQMGVGDHPPTEEEVRTFEANGLTSEWDSGAACVAVLLLERLRQGISFPLSDEWPQALSALAAHPLSLPHPDYAAAAARIGQRLGGRTGAAAAARAALWQQAQSIPDLAPHLLAFAAQLATLLGHTHDFYRAPVTRHFQHRVIGSQGVAAAYEVSPRFENPAYLEVYDRPLLSPEAREKLRALLGKGAGRAALYTARPSLPPLEAQRARVGYSPEAEMARSLVEMDDVPLIGLGRMQWLAGETGQPVEHLVKPSPVQALAAIGAAWSGREVDSLRAASVLQREGELHPPLGDLEPVVLHVFEDTVGGIAAVERAVEGLRAAGVRLSWQPYGIVPDSGPKEVAMRTYGVPIYRSIDEAVLSALGQRVEIPCR